MKEEVYTYRALQAGSTAHHTKPHEEALGFVQEAEKAKEKHGREVLSQFPVGEARQGRGGRLRIG